MRGTSDDTNSKKSFVVDIPKIEIDELYKKLEHKKIKEHDTDSDTKLLSIINSVQDSLNKKEEKNKVIKIDDANKNENLLEHTQIITIVSEDENLPVIDKTSKIETTVKQIDYVYKSVINGFIAALLIVIGAIFIINSYSEETETTINYNESTKVDYKVYINDASFYGTNVLAKDRLYITNLIDNISIDYSYNFASDDKFNIRYEYYVDATTTISDSTSGTELLTKTDTLVPRQIVKNNEVQTFALAKNVIVNYLTYDNYVKEFNNTYGVSTTSNVSVVLHISGYDDKNRRVVNNSMSVLIPLNNKTITIDYNNEPTSNGKIVLSKIDKHISNFLLFYIGSVLIVCALGLIIYIVVILLKNKRKKTKYEKTLSRILRDYDRAIVGVSKSISFENSKFIDVKNFDELIDLRDNLEKPILHIENETHEKSLFIVIGEEGIVYRYILDGKELS